MCLLGLGNGPLLVLCEPRGLEDAVGVICGVLVRLLPETAETFCDEIRHQGIGVQILRIADQFTPAFLSD